MALYLETLAFALLIGGQFLAAIVLISKRASIYGDVRQPELNHDQPQLSERSPRVPEPQHSAKMV